jgi:hypothetical protein
MQDWITAADAVARLEPVMDWHTAQETIARRAHDGMIRCRAARFVRPQGRTEDNVDLPREFWWARGGAALQQNWKAGDFATWIDNR